MQLPLFDDEVASTCADADSKEGNSSEIQRQADAYVSKMEARIFASLFGVAIGSSSDQVAQGLAWLLEILPTKDYIKH